MHAVDMERMILPVLVPLAEHLERRVLRRRREGEERQILMLAVRDQFPHQLVLRIHLRFLNALDLGIFLQRVFQIRKRGFQLLRAAAGLRGMRLVADHGKVPAVRGVDFLIDHGELLQRRNNDAHTVIQRLF